jgi:DinB superfamily
VDVAERRSKAPSCQNTNQLAPTARRLYESSHATLFEGKAMQKDILLELVKQNQFTSNFCFDRVTEENASLKLNDNTASIGFIYRHIGETINLFGQFLGTPTDVTNTTIGQIDNGQHYDVGHSRELIELGYKMLQALVESSSDEDWLKPVDTPFFGTVSRIRLFSHALFHTSNHAGQISLTLAKGSR